jgi:hypothetical protein
LKVASFTVGATQEQAIRWKRAAEADGHRAVGSWLAVAADLYLKVRARAGNPIPLAWQRGTLWVFLVTGAEVEVRGMVSPPFGIFAGTRGGYDGHHERRSLVHLPSRQIIATLRTARQAKALACELAPVWLRDRELAAGVVNRHERESS